MRQESRITKQSNKPTIPRTTPARARERSVAHLRDKMQDLGVDMEGTEEVIISYHFADSVIECGVYFVSFFRLILPEHVVGLVHFHVRDLNLDQLNDSRPRLRTDLLLGVRRDHQEMNRVSRTLQYVELSFSYFSVIK